MQQMKGKTIPNQVVFMQGKLKKANGERAVCVAWCFAMALDLNLQVEDDFVLHGALPWLLISIYLSTTQVEDGHHAHPSLSFCALTAFPHKIWVSKFFTNPIQG